MQSWLFRNADVISSGRRRKKDIYIYGGRFVRKLHQRSHSFDCCGLLMTPGFIDLQINGYGGKEFVGSDEAVALAQQSLPSYGVTSFLPTIVSHPLDRYRPSVLKSIIENSRTRNGAEVLGWHLEGPFLHPLQRGVHQASCLLDRVDEPFWKEVFSTKVISLMTLAPELELAGKLLPLLKKYQVKIAVGHSQAEKEHLQYAKEYGATFVTHLYNAMLPFHHRAPGIVGAVLGSELLGYSIVCDLYHVHQEAIQMAWKSFPKGLALISDAAPLFGSQDREGAFCGGRVFVTGDRILTAPGGNISGSVVSLLEQFYRFMNVTGCSFEEAVRVVTETPASFVGVSQRKGKITVGYDADCVFWNVNEDRYEIIATMTRGEISFAKEEFWERSL